jgi:hypothetical protein
MKKNILYQKSKETEKLIIAFNLFEYAIIGLFTF